MYQITIKIPKHLEDAVPTSNVNLESIRAEAIWIMDNPLSSCSNDSFDSISFNHVGSDDITMFNDLIASCPDISITANEIGEGN